MFSVWNLIWKKDLRIIISYFLVNYEDITLILSFFNCGYTWMEKVSNKEKLLKIKILFLLDLEAFNKAAWDITVPGSCFLCNFLNQNFKFRIWSFYFNYIIIQKYNIIQYFVYP